MKIVLMRFVLIIILGVFFILTPSFGVTPAQTVNNNSNNNNNKNVHLVLDLGGVCINTHYTKTLQSLGLSNIMLYMLWYFKKPSVIKKKFYRMLNRIKYNDDTNEVRDYNQDTLPELMCDWMTNKLTNEELRLLVTNNIDAHPEWFLNKTEQALMYNFALMMFTPELFIDTRTLSSSLLHFVAQCKKNGFKVSVLSNWDKESFALLSKKYASFFNQCEAIRISGDNGYLKPYKNAYSWFIEQYPDDVFIFIDDQIENIIAAEKVGMLGILYTNNSVLTLNQVHDRMYTETNISY